MERQLLCGAVFLSGLLAVIRQAEAGGVKPTDLARWRCNTLRYCTLHDHSYIKDHPM